MDERILRVFERLGSRTIWVGGCVMLGSSALAITVEALSGIGYAGNTTRMASIVELGTFLSTVAIVLAVIFVRPIAMPALRWTVDRGSVGAAEAWLSAVRGLDRAIALGVGLFTVAVIPLAVYTQSALEVPFYELPLVFLYMELFVFFAAVLDFFVLRWLMRPLINNIASFLPSDFDPGYRTLPLRTQLMLTMTVVGGLVGVVSVGSGAGDIGAKLAIGLGSAALVMALVGVGPSFLAAEEVSRPIRELIAAAKRVEHGDLSTRVPVLGADEGGILAREFNSMLHGLQEREQLRSAMGSYVDPEVAQRVLSEGELLAGEEVTATIMFIDIRGFTTWCDQHSAEDTVRRLNEFFDLVVPAIASLGGHTNKFLGDGLLAVFGVPARHEDHADRAVAAAGLVVDVVSERFGDDLRIGVGINTGPIVAGSIGGGGRLEFAVIGDTVNVASRIEQLTKDTGDAILIAETTRDLLREPISLVSRGSTVVRGKPDPLRLYAVKRAAPARATKGRAAGARRSA